MKYAKIVTKLPHPLDLKLLKDINKYEANSMQGQIPVVWDRAKDFMVYDRHGNEFIDFTSGICVTNCGHGNTDIVNAIRKKINIPLTHAYTFGTEIRYKFLKELVDTCYPKGKAFLVSAGTEATEVAIKLMRLKKNKRGIISFYGSMHGRTSLAENLTGRYDWATLDKNIIHLRFPDIGDSFETELEIALETEEKISLENIAGVMIESYRGWDANFFTKKYIQELVAWAKKRDILICFDEIQGGFGRTGKMWAWEHYDIPQPDLICFGKGVSSSVPLSGVIGRQDILDCVEVGSMSSTHSANPISCAAGLANIQYMKKHKLIERAERLGNEMMNFLTDYLGLRVEGNGLLCAIHTIDEKSADNIVMECFKRGLLLIRTHKASVKIAPPLTITDEALTEGLEIISEVIKC
jgi:4-aminobutyrate aminotransferase-like enzyme